MAKRGDEMNGKRMEPGALEGDLLTVASRAEALPDTAERLRRHIAALEQHISELETSLEDVRKERDDLARRLKEEQDEVALKQAALDGLARLKPSGHVAVEARRLERSLNAFSDGDFKESLRAAIASLAAKAQCYEALAESERVQEELFAIIASKLGQQPEEDTLSAVERVVAEAGTLRAHCEHYDVSLTKARNALRDAGVTDTAGVVPNHSALTAAQRIALLAAERDAAVADNAALVKDLKDVLAAHDAEAQPYVFSTIQGFRAALAQPHPGAALLAEVEKMRPAWTRLLTIAAGQGRSIGGVLDDAEQHRRALVRARNEGREQAAQMAADVAISWDAANGGSGAATGPRIGAVVNAIRAMKEPEQ